MAVIDLLPSDVRDTRREASRIRVAGIAAAGVFAICIAFGVSQQLELRSQRSQLAQAQQTLAKVESDVAQLDWIAAIQSDIILRQTSLSQALAGDLAWPAVLTGINDAVTGRAVLTGLTSTTGANGATAPATLTLTGRTSDFPGLATLLDAVAGVEVISSSYPTTGSRSEDGTGADVTFTVTAAVSEDAGSGRCIPGGKCP